MDGIEVFNSGKPITLTAEQQPARPIPYNGLVSYIAYHTIPAPLVPGITRERDREASSAR
jgi:hypothetical protein